MGSALPAVGTAARRQWYGLSMPTRQRLTVALGALAVAALVWFLAIPNLPCQFPAGDACPPSDDAAEIVPGDALAYVHANIDPADRIDEEKLDVTAPMIAARPSRPIAGGVT